MSKIEKSGNKITTRSLLKMKKEGKKITALTAYDVLTAKILDKAGVDIILVGDSLGMVYQGHETTLPVTVEQIIYHTQAVKRGVERAFLVADMPFMSYQISEEKAIENAGRMIKEGGANAVKIEGGKHVIPLAAKLIQIGIPVVAHIGLTPQSINQFGSYKTRARDEEEAQKLIEAAKGFDKICAAAIVLEKVPYQLAKRVSEEISIPTIGIGAGKFCDGQILVTEDLLGLFDDFKPKFVRHYANLNNVITRAVENYISDVQKGEFPNLEESYE